MEQNVRILLLAEDSLTLKNMQLELSDSGNHIELINDLATAYRKVMAGHYDIIVTELEFDSENKGLKFISDIRRSDMETFIIVYSKITDPIVKVEALRSGADAYIERPTNPKVIKAQILAFLKRFNYSIKDNEEKNVAIYRDITVNRETRTIYVSGNAISMSDKEYRIVRMLMRAEGKPVSKEDIMLRVWGYYEDDNRVVDVYIAKIRSKIGKDKIHTIRLKGYMLY